MDMLILFPIGAGLATLVTVLASGAFLTAPRPRAEERRREPKHALR